MNRARDGRRTGVLLGVLLAAVLALLFIAPRREGRDDAADGPRVSRPTRRHADTQGARRDAQGRGGAAHGEEASVVGQATPASREGLPSTGDMSPEREAEAARVLDRIPNPIETMAVSDGPPGESAVPTGLAYDGARVPGAEALGYSQNVPPGRPAAWREAGIRVRIDGAEEVRVAEDGTALEIVTAIGIVREEGPRAWQH